MSRALYLRSRALPAVASSLVAAALLAGWAAYELQAARRFGGTARIPVVTLAPMLAAGIVGTGLYTHSDELDRTAVRAWWPRRLAHLFALTALAAAGLALAVPGSPEVFGGQAMVRNVLGATGIAAGSAALLGARLSWLPTTVYLSGTYLSAPPTHDGVATVWAWPMQPGPQPGAWLTACTTYVCGAALHAWRGARPDGS
ncbi:hypothetical protein HY68_04045 [Streptomyces sp. AcH 505]|uniref:hypothetical protein n=1 Tax=Streptomyces sp. AcH 505 TaxID=352211 RepID=UPI0005923733|nr:hypothetical protein HY68_04045 [Streptomyces sp. AcH 505]